MFFISPFSECGHWDLEEWQVLPEMVQLGNQQARIQRQPEAIPCTLSFKRNVHTRLGVMGKMRIHALTPAEVK